MDQRKDQVGKILLLTGLVALIGGTIGAGIYYGHYFVVGVFAVWVVVEAVLWRFPTLLRPQPRSQLNECLDLYKRDQASWLDSRIAELSLGEQMSDSQRRWLDRLKGLSHLKALTFGEPLRGKGALRQSLVFGRHWEGADPLEHMDEITLQDVTESATVVADLYWRLFEIASGEFGELTPLARDLYRKIFGESFGESGRERLPNLMDVLQREHGMPFLVLNLLTQGRQKVARRLTRQLLLGSEGVDEEVRSSLYWLVELTWFQTSPPALDDFESTIRYLYHLCFTDPNRTGFLEVDSQFFAQFETVNELAREGLLFREELVDHLLELWRGMEGWFDEVLGEALEQLTGQPGKIYDCRSAWVAYWERDRENFSKEWLFVVEGNLCYARQYYSEAAKFYERALEIDPNLRPALLNLTFVYAHNDPHAHEAHVERLRGNSELFPASLYVSGNSYLLRGDRKRSDVLFEELSREEGWKQKADYYRSLFAFDHGMAEIALEFARRATELNPNDSAIGYHLSRCYSALGESESALRAIKRVGEANISPTQSQWLSYYRFRLERDAGREQEASDTLWQIPSDYFEDPEELEEAEEFAKRRKDLALLHHLRHRR